MSTHILLVSAQAAPNLLPALDPALKPERAVLLVTAKMTSQADALETVLGEAGVRTSRVALADEHDFGQLEDALMGVATSTEDADIAFNLTGGTKLMTLAAQSVAKAAGWRMFYVDADTDEVIWLGDKPHRQALNDQLRLRHYLRGYGFTIAPGQTTPHFEPRHRDLLRTLILQVGSLERPLGQLNYLAQTAKDTQLTVKLTASQQDSRSLEALLRHFADAGVLKID